MVFIESLIVTNNTYDMPVTVDICLILDIYDSPVQIFSAAVILVDFVM